MRFKDRIIQNKKGEKQKIQIPRNTAIFTGLHGKYRQAKKAYKIDRINGKRY